MANPADTILVAMPQDAGRHPPARSSAPFISRNPTVARYQAYRGQIEHEDHLLGVRVGWLIAAEAFLSLAHANLANANHLSDVACSLSQ